MGDIVRVHRHGDVEWIIVGQTYDKAQWRLISVELDRRGVMRRSLSVGSGNIVTVTPAPNFVPGQQVRWNGGSANVLHDRGDTVLLAIPPNRFKTRAGDHLHLAASQSEVSKANLVLENLHEGVNHG